MKTVCKKHFDPFYFQILDLRSGYLNLIFVTTVSQKIWMTLWQMESEQCFSCSICTYKKGWKEKLREHCICLLRNERNKMICWNLLLWNQVNGFRCLVIYYFRPELGTEDYDLRYERFDISWFKFTISFKDFQR